MASETDIPCLKQPYPFRVERIPRFSAKNVSETIAASAVMSAERPVVITDLHLIDSSMQWTPEYLAEHCGNAVKFSVFHSKTNKFLYWDPAKDYSVYEFEKPTEKTEMICSEFVEKYMKAEAAGEADENGFRYHYLQQNLVQGVGEQILKDLTSWDWDQVRKYQQLLGFGPLTTNMTFIGQKHCETPCHYDEQQNIYVQICGRKKFVLFSPESFGSMYPFPLHHPNDRQAQVDIFNPDLDRFPNFKDAIGHETIIGPGDVLFLPSYWWHYVFSLDNTVSVNFWFKSLSPEKVVFPLNHTQLTSLKRNLEELIGKSVGPRRVPEILAGIITGNCPDDLKESAAAVLKLLEQVQFFGDEAVEFVKLWYNGRYNIARKPSDPKETTAQIEDKDEDEGLPSLQSDV